MSPDFVTHPTRGDTDSEYQIQTNASVCSGQISIKKDDLDLIPTLPYAYEERRTYSQIFHLLTEKEQDFLGNFRSNENLSKDLRALQFPKSLRFLEVDIPEAQTYHFLSFFNTTANISLVIRNTMNPIVDPDRPLAEIQLPTVKHVSIDFAVGEIDSRPLTLLKAFPNVESLRLSHDSDRASANIWKGCIPDLPKLREITLPWPQGERVHVYHLDGVEHGVKECLKNCEFKSLQSIELVKPGIERGSVIGKISREMDVTSQTRNWVFEWKDSSPDHSDLIPAPDGGHFGRVDLTSANFTVIGGFDNMEALPWC
ncbi:hypothetical protein TWF718_006367 [Orbilia javanica]|uniref:Uncharacterized protein n=1 Tax=Orbilia javanica TaxID=47235 RepID=A0AAN8RJV9_9PEZI